MKALVPNDRVILQLKSWNRQIEIKRHKMKPGLVLKPKTEINEEILEAISLGHVQCVLIMTVGKSL